MATLSVIGSSYQLVGIAEFGVASQGNTILATHCLGACLGVAVYDPEVRAGGLLHAMLPKSDLDPVKARKQPGLFLDSGIPALIEAVCQLGAKPERLRLAAAGGAEIMDADGVFAIGGLNRQALLRVTYQMGLALQATHIGGRDNRSLMLHIATGEVWLKLTGQQKSILLCKNSTIT